MSDAETTEEYRRFEEWLLEQCPIDLGDDNHRAGWDGEPGDSDLWWVHHCPDHRGKNSLGRIDVTTGERHQLITVDPLHIEASVKCVGCGDHGFIRNGKWVAA